MEATRLLTELQRQVQPSDQIAASPAYLDDPDYIEEYQKIRKICSSRYTRTRELKKKDWAIYFIAICTVSPANRNP